MTNKIDMHTKTVCGVLLCAALTGVTQAQLRASLFTEITTTQFRNSSVEQAPGFYGDLAISATQNDNIFRDETNEVDDQIFTLEPNLNYRNLFSKHSLDIGYQGAYGFYLDNDDENFDDHNVDAVLALDLTEKIDVNLEGGYRWSHDLRGASRARLETSIKPDTWEESRLFAGALYGRRTNQGQFEFSVEAKGLDYTNNQQEVRDRDQLNFSGTFYYNVTGKTSWLFEARLTDIDYVNTSINPLAVNLDSQEQRYFVGARWEATELTRGEIRLGYVNKDLDQANLDDFNGVGVEGELEWTPLATDLFVFSLIRTPRESIAVEAATASYFVMTRIGATWYHSLTSLWSLYAGAHAQEDDYSDNRKDDLLFFNLGTNYSLSERISLSGRYTYRERDSNISNADYKTNELMITLTLQPGINSTRSFR
ncbi:MAG: outer membrane beta-barrel protein [Gammaproteobacteria bacterium]|nr:outer membrane beta-barrel protein [Gammaproteobacteria bacterium]